MQLAPGSPSVQSQTPQLLSDFTLTRGGRGRSHVARSGRVLIGEVPTGRRCPTGTDVADALSFVPSVASLHPQSSESTVHVHAGGAASAVLCVDTRLIGGASAPLQRPPFPQPTN